MARPRLDCFRERVFPAQLLISPENMLQKRVCRIGPRLFFGHCFSLVGDSTTIMTQRRKGNTKSVSIRTTNRLLFRGTRRLLKDDLTGDNRENRDSTVSSVFSVCSC